VTVERLHEGAVSSIAVGKPPKLASFGAEPYLFDGKAWVERPLAPKDSLGPLDLHDAAIFFGRDNQPRLLGKRSSQQGDGPLYLRHKPRGWAEEPSELGGLASSSTALYGILGYDDPEVVCAIGSFCLVKRLSGWKRTPAMGYREQFFLTSEGVYVERQGQLLWLDDAEWKQVATVPSGIRALCHETPRRAWLTTADNLYLWDLDGGEPLAAEPVPVGSATGLLCEREGSLWVTGNKGAAVREADRWFRLDGVEGPLWAIARGHDAVLVGGKHGLFRVRRAP
jgi:hypothetical protein